MKKMQPQTSRREFLKTTTAFTTGAVLTTGLGINRSAHAAGSDEIRVVLIGCGGRGGGAIHDRLQVNDNVKLVALADAFENRAVGLANALRNDEQLKGKIDLPNERVFAGLDAYLKAMECLRPGDQILDASPPGFRPIHYHAAVKRGLHAFLEKPCCTDAAGFRLLMETNKLADEKNLKVCVGLQRHYQPDYVNWMKQVQDGMIGAPVSSHVYWNRDSYVCLRREPGEGELQYQVRNWFHFTRFSGDNISEQNIHNIDIGLWFHGKGDPMAHPVMANGMGGRTFHAGPEDVMKDAPSFYKDREAWDAWYAKNRQHFNRHGHVWDQFFVEFSFADESKMLAQSRQINNVWNFINESIVGPKGSGTPGRLLGPDRQVIWTNHETFPKGPYQWEHDCLVKAIREGTPLNDGYHGAMSSMTAVFGREAAYSGQMISWDDAINKGIQIMPMDGYSNFDQEPSIKPDENGFYESSVPVPGIYTPFVTS